MKKQFILLFLCCFFELQVSAQKQDWRDSLVNLGMKEIPSEYKFIKSFWGTSTCKYGRKDYEYICVFSENTNYVFNIKSLKGKPKV